ncbi:MAG: alpha/beta fold hydrolase [Candidatus Omnitrophica bacterium]|nr:alpha/beta fold hydrolase [Candidatus Omnitrophota bacterium]
MMEFETSLLSTPDGVRVSLDRYGRGSHKTAILICPGFFQSKDTPTFQRLARALTQERDVLAMDFRGHGRSSGLYTFSAREGSDLETVLQFAKARYQHLVILAFSLGGAIAINTLSRVPEQVRRLLTVSTPACVDDIEFKWWTPEAMRTGVQGCERGAGCRPGNLFLKKDRPLARVQHLAPIPTCFLHGTRDVIVGVEHSRRLYAQAGEPKRLEIIEGGSHAEALFRDDPEDFLRRVNDWVRGTLPKPLTEIHPA